MTVIRFGLAVGNDLIFVGVTRHRNRSIHGAAVVVRDVEVQGVVSHTVLREGAGNGNGVAASVSQVRVPSDFVRRTAALDVEAHITVVVVVARLDDGEFLDLQQRRSANGDGLGRLAVLGGDVGVFDRQRVGAFAKILKQSGKVAGRTFDNVSLAFFAPFVMVQMGVVFHHAS